MSSRWKSPFQKTKKERQQPASREHLGILEKKKDYILRARAAQKQQKEIQRLRREAALRNPDEFYFSMITDVKKKPMETKLKPITKFTKEQRQLLETRDQNYIESKLQIQKNKIEKIKRQLPPSPEKKLKVYKTVEEALAAQAQEQEEAVEERPEIVALRKELNQRKEIVRQLEEVLEEMLLQKKLKTDPEAKTIEEEDGSVSYEWKNERKR